MTEYDGYNLRNQRGTYYNPLFFNLYDGLSKELLKSVDLPPIPRQLQEGDFLNISQIGERTGFVTVNYYSAKLGKFFGERAGALFLVRAQGKHMQRLATYLKTDRLAYVARLKTVDNIPLAKMITVILGVNYKDVLVSNEKGLAYGYLLPDNYYNTLVISPNGIVYQEIDRKTDSVGTYDIICGRITKANVPTRQPHRKFV